MHEPNFSMHPFHYLGFIVGIFYFMLGNIDPKFRSTLHTIQLVAVVRTQLMEQYPVGEILEPFMDDVKKLESVSNVFTLSAWLYR